MAWHILEQLLEQTAAHSTLVGKFWTTFFFVLRFLMVVSIADTVYGDDKDDFECNVETPGCENVCFNDYSPISLIRLWAFQILCVALPAVIFMVYTAHKMEKISQAKKLKAEEQEKKKKQREVVEKMRANFRKKSNVERRKTGSTNPPGYAESVMDVDKPEEKKEEKKDDDDAKVCATKLDTDTPSRLMLAYIAQVVLRLVIEIAFMTVQYHTYSFKFWVPEIFKCARYPCPNVVDCFVSRPKEKTIVLWIMFSTGLVMIILNVVELYHIGAAKIWEAWSTRGDDITKRYKVQSNSMPMFGGNGRNYRGGYPQAVGIRVGYARSSLSGEGGNDFDGDQFI